MSSLRPWGFGMNLYVRAVTAMVGVAILGLGACGGDRTSTLSSGAAGRRVAAVVPPAASDRTGRTVPVAMRPRSRTFRRRTRQRDSSSSAAGSSATRRRSSEQRTEKGLVIAADGHWAKLASVSAGSAVEMAGAANRGTWKLIDNSASNGPGHFEIHFTELGGGSRLLVGSRHRSRQAPSWTTTASTLLAT